MQSQWEPCHLAGIDKAIQVIFPLWTASRGVGHGLERRAALPAAGALLRI
jgi:hypothetical protein